MGSRESGSPVNLITKYALFFLNFTLFLVCGAVTGLMAWILVEKEKAVLNAYDFFLDPACVLCLAGSVAFVVSFFGWYGSLREYVFFLAIYRYIMMFLFFVEMVFIVLIFVIVYVPESRNQLNIYPEDSLKEAIVKYRDDEDMQNLIDGIQELLECCGTSNDDIGYKDWARNPYFNCSTELETSDFGEFCSVPFSCCKKENNGLINYLCGRGMQKSTTSETLRSETIYIQGCFKSITSILQNNVIVVGGVIIGILIPQMLLTSFTGRLIEQIEMQMAKWNRQQMR
ncbi:tetraspanin-33-like isoform X2 [Ruditapes philippinarum]|uniref:tetraspanin-33-like isoform X2 n=1 Tax=Ruditapes philippinarum TaxID=129788 RepID=UPI00295B7743|nr:tetraspanin-33-like isoform X2 [Ruditapes philippinarum]